MKTLAFVPRSLVLLVLVVSACSSAVPDSPLDARDLSKVTVALAQSGLHACRIDGSGQLWCWGANDWGQVRPDARTLVEPVQRPYTGLSDVAQVALMHDHACVLHRDGQVSCWGNNQSGQLGDGSNESRFAPVRVPGLADVDALALETGVSCAHQRHGGWLCWGGDATSGTVHGISHDHLHTLMPGMAAKRPTAVPRLANVSALSLGTLAGAALRTSGQVLSWGYGRWEEPLPVPGLSDAIEVRAGYMEGCALRRGGKVSCWSIDLERKVMTVPGLDRARSLSGGPNGYCATRQDQSLWCWQLSDGDGDTLALYEPIKRFSGASQVVAVTGASTYGCTAASNGVVECRGSNRTGELGDGSSVTTPVPTEVPNLTQVVAVDTDDSPSDSTCALRADGTVWCWGRKSEWTVPDEPNVDRSLPTPVLDLSDAVELHTPCAKRRDATIVCWDSSRWGRVTSGSVTPLPLVTVRGLGGRVTSFAVRESLGCASVRDGRVFCWSPRDPQGRAKQHEKLTNVAQVAMGAKHTCARTRPGAVWCWGLGTHGQFGDGTRFFGLNPYRREFEHAPRETPGRVSGLADATALWAGQYQTCVLRRGDDAPWCFGNSAHDGPSGPNPSLVPVRVASLAGVMNVASGYSHQCSIDKAGALRCSGANHGAVLGSNAVEATEHTPLRDGVTAVSAGQAHTCAVREGRVLCWGSSDAGQVGLGRVLRLDEQGLLGFADG